MLASVVATAQRRHVSFAACDWTTHSVVLVVVAVLCVLPPQANASLTQQLADHERLLRSLRDEASELAARLSSTQEALTAKDRIIEQLRAPVRGRSLCLFPGPFPH